MPRTPPSARLEHHRLHRTTWASFASAMAEVTTAGLLLGARCRERIVKKKVNELTTTRAEGVWVMPSCCPFKPVTERIVFLCNRWLTFGSCWVCRQKASASSHLTPSDFRQGREDRCSLRGNAKSAPQSCSPPRCYTDYPLACRWASIASTFSMCLHPSPTPSLQAGGSWWQPLSPHMAEHETWAIPAHSTSNQPNNSI